MAAASVLLRACGLALAGVAGASEDAVAMVQGRLSFRADPKVAQDIEALGPFTMSSDTVAARLPDSRPSSATVWAGDDVKSITARGLSADGVQAGALMVGGASKEQSHAFVNMGYTGLKDPKMPNSGSLMGAAKVTPKNMELIGAVPNKDGTVEYGKLRTAVDAGHLTPAQVSAQWGRILGLEEPAMKHASEVAEKQQRAHPAAEEASAKQSMEKAAAEKAATERSIVEHAMQQAGAQWAKEHPKEQETAKAAAKYAFEQAAAKKAVEEAAARKALEEAAAKKAMESAAARKALEAAQAEAVKRAEHEAAARQAAEQAEKQAAEQAAARQAAEEAARSAKAAEWAAKRHEAEQVAEAKKVEQEALAKHAADQKQLADWAAAAQAAQAKKAEQEVLPQEVLLQMEPNAPEYLRQLLESSQEQHAGTNKAFKDWVKKHADGNSAGDQAFKDWVKKHADAMWGKNTADANATKSKALGDWIKKHSDALWGKTKSEEKAQDGAELKTQVIGNWIKRNADAAWGKAKPGGQGQELGDWLHKQADATFGKKKVEAEVQKKVGAEVQGASKALSDWFKSLGNATKEPAKPTASSEASKNKEIGDALQAIGKAVKHAAEQPRSAKQGPPTLEDILGSLSKAAQVASKPAALLQRDTEVSQAEEAEEEEEEEGLQPKVADMAEEHRKASEAANDAVRKIASAKAKMSKAIQTIQKGKKRITVLEEENSTAVAKWERAHAKRMQYTDKAVSYRLKQAERETLKGKHLKFDKATYLQRVKNGNFSTYGLWQTYDTKQHFGEKTWDILSNHIFGLDKFMKFLFNATEVETKAKRYLKLEKHYSAMGAAAQEELLELSSSIEQAEKDIEQAKEDIAEATTAKSDLKAMKKEAKRMLVKEKAAKKTASRKQAKKAKKAAKGSEEEELGSEEEANDEEEQASEEAEEAEEGEEEEEASEDSPEEADDAEEGENQEEEKEEQGEEESEEEEEGEEESEEEEEGEEESEEEEEGEEEKE